MAIRLRAAVIAALGLVLLLGSPFASAAEPTTQELVDQIKQLQSKVEQLEAKQNQSSADLAATVDKIVHDAESRSKLMSEAGGIQSVWHDGHFILASDDNRFVMKPGAYFQFRSVTNYNTADDSTENGFDDHRLKIWVEGNLFTPQLTYKILYVNSESTGNLTLQDLWGKYDFTPNWGVRAGQFLNPVVHEQLVSGKYQLTTDRTLLNQLIAGEQENYVQGVTLCYDDKGPMRAEFGFTDGISSQNTSWRDFPANSTDFGMAGRVEYFAIGKDRKMYNSFSAYGASEDLLVLGAGGDITQAGDTTVYLHTLDASWQSPKGCSAYAAYEARLNDTAAGNTYDWGFVMQGGYLFRPKIEGFVRYDFTKFEDAVLFPGGGSQTSFNEFTIGMNYYLYGHGAKFTVDACYLPDGCPNDQIGLGYLASSQAEYVLRAQFQLAL